MYRQRGADIGARGTDYSAFHVGIFDMDGTMLINRIVGCGEEISVADLRPAFT